MSRLELPIPAAVAAPPFTDAASASAWLRQQPLAEPAQMQGLLHAAIQALDGSTIAAAERVQILEVLRGAAILAQSAGESRYLRKPLPLPAADVRAFAAARQLWRMLAVAYLRTVPHLPAAEAARSLHRGAVALRDEQYACFLAAHEVPQELLRLLYDILLTAEAMGVQRLGLADPEYKYLGESHIAGHIAWAFLLQFIDPYRLTPAQLAVANRAFSRWRELAGFQAMPADDAKARTLALDLILDPRRVPEGGPRWLEVRAVARKLRKRVESLQAGESPEQLKLGRELTGDACIRLLQQLGEALRARGAGPAADSGDLRLFIGPENVYALVSGRDLKPRAALDPTSRSISHQRMAVFGFDNLVAHPDAVARLDIPNEIWQAGPGGIRRQADAGGRVVSPGLVANVPGVEFTPRLGVLTSLQACADGSLRARLQWYPQAARAGVIPGPGSDRLPVFILGEGSDLSLLLPANARVQAGGRLSLDGEPPLRLGAVLERGADFVRYAVELQ